MSHLTRVPTDVWIWLGTFVLLLWLWSDTRAWNRATRRRNELSHEGAWELLSAEYQRQLRSLRPWLVLFRRFLFPGGLEAMYSVHLYQLGRAPEALAWAEVASRKSAGHELLWPQAMVAKGLAVLELGRYEDARDCVARIRSRSPQSSSADQLEALIALYLGRLDQALALAKRASLDPKKDVARGLVSLVHLLKGEHRPALEILLDHPLEVTALYSPESLGRLRRTPEGRSQLEAHQKMWAGVVQPLRFIHAAYVHLDQEDVEGLRYALDQAKATMGGNPILRRIHRELEACLAALGQDAAGVERSLAEGREILQRFPKRVSSLELDRFSGRAHLMLGQSALAVTEFERSLGKAQHPLEKHVSRYWLARGLEAHGDSVRAAELYRDVAGDGIPSRFVAEAGARLKGSKV